MIDIFLQKDIKNLLKNKNVVFMGDSNIRALYKDTLCLLKCNKLISQKILKTKGENSCFGDKLLFLGPRYNGREYREERRGSCGSTILSFYFLTRVYDKYVKQIVNELSRNERNMPDILIINSCLWDVTRWGPNGVNSYKKNLVLLMQDLKKQMPDCLIIWVTAPPIACDPSGGFLVKEIEFMKYSIRFHVVEANHYARKVVVDHGFDVVDSHYHLKLEIHRRTPDGIHWFPEAVRYVTNLLLTHISIACNIPLPHRFKPGKLEGNTSSSSEEEDVTHLNKVSSVIVKPNDIAKCTSDKQKENNKKKEIFVTPQRFKKRRKPLREKNSHFQESHHSYLKKVEYKERNNRIRKWKKPVESSPCNIKPVESKNLSKNYFRFRAHCSSYSSQNPSGNQSNLNNQSSNTYAQQMFDDSPRHMPLFSNPYEKPEDAILNSPSNHAAFNTHDQQRFIESPRHIPLLQNSYHKPDDAFLDSPLNHASYNTNNQQSLIDSPRHMPLLSPYEQSNKAFLQSPLIHTSYDQQRFIDSPRHTPLLPNSYEKSNAFLDSPSNHASYNTHDKQRLIDSPRNMQLLSNPYEKSNDAFLQSPSSHASYNTYDQQRFINSPRHIPLPSNSYEKSNDAFFNSSLNHASYNQILTESTGRMPLLPNSYQTPGEAYFNSPLPGYKTEMHISPQIYNVSPMINIQVPQPSDSHQVLYRRY